MGLKKKKGVDRKPKGEESVRGRKNKIATEEKKKKP